MDRTFDPDAFIRRIGQRLVDEFNDARAATTPGTVGSAMEQPVRKQLEQILPRGIAVGSGFIIDSYGNTSRQTDVVLYERDICPVFSINDTPGTTYYPCECVIAVVEVKSALDRDSLQDAFTKIESAKALRRHLVHHEVPDPKTGQQWPIYRSYGSLHDSLINGGLRDITKQPGELAEIFGCVLAGESRLQEDSLATTFLKLTHTSGDARAPNLLVTLSGIALSWGTTTDTLPGRILKREGTYVLSVAHGGPQRWERKWSGRTADLLGLEHDDGFRVLVKWIRAIYHHGRTSAVSALDHYFRNRKPQPTHVRPFRRETPTTAVPGGEHGRPDKRE